MIGAIIGDVVGSRFEFNNIKTKEFDLFSRGSRLTDDSIMTLAIMECFQKRMFEENQIIDTLKKWGQAFPNAGYGGRFYHWVLSNDRKPYGSYGNGAAMRISPVGFYANSEEDVRRLSRAFTAVTHNHPEGLKGAEVTAMCIYYAKSGKSKEFIKEYVEKYYSLDFDYEELRRTYSHDEEICQCTVPQAIYCFLISNSFEDCLRTTISLGGDCDTTAAISCAIAEAYYHYIPYELYKGVLDRLPEVRNDCNAASLIYNYLSSAFIYLTDNDNDDCNYKLQIICEHVEYDYNSNSVEALGRTLFMLIDGLLPFTNEDDCAPMELIESFMYEEYVNYLVYIGAKLNDNQKDRLLNSLSNLLKNPNLKNVNEAIDLINEINEVYEYVHVELIAK